MKPRNYLFCLINKLSAAEAEGPHFPSKITEKQDDGYFSLFFTQSICFLNVSH